MLILPPSLQKPITESDLDSNEDNLPSPSGEGSNEVHDSVEAEADNKMARLDNNIGYVAFEGEEDILMKKTFYLNVGTLVQDGLPTLILIPIHHILTLSSRNGMMTRKWMRKRETM
jgi:hypothetical protein